MRFFLEHCPPNPTLEYADSFILPEGTTEIVSRGGGSTIDVGKWLARKYNVPHVVIPTTAGTGSEITRYSVLNVDGRKKTFTDDKFLPEGYILDPFLTVSLPEIHTLSTGLDALSQSMESLWSKHATNESVAYATVGMKLSLDNIKKAIDNPKDVRARMSMMIAANMSGRAIDITQTNICHAISYPLTDWYKIPHGIACGLSLSYFAKKMGYDVDIIKSLLPKYKIDIKKVANEVLKNPKLEDFPLPVTKMDIYHALS